jgi:signal peptidase I
VASLLLINDLFFFESVLIPSSSMRPTILPNERIFLQKFGFRTLNRFDVVVVGSKKLGKRLAKRVIALPGDRVRIEGSWKVFINDECLDYSEENAVHQRIEAGDHTIQVLKDQKPSFEARFGGHNLILGPDEYFVLGDNRLASDDSRFIGPVKRHEIEGKLGTVWYSYDFQQHRLRTERLLRSVR